MTPDRRSFVVHGDRVGELRCRLGPTAWVVLEELLARSVGTPPRCQAVATTRTLASELHLSKNTAARAIATLRRVDLVAPVQTRTPAGAFASGHYRIVVPDGIAFVDGDREHAPAHPATTKTRATRPIGSQLAFGLDG